MHQFKLVEMRLKICIGNVVLKVEWKNRPHECPNFEILNYLNSAVIIVHDIKSETVL